MAFDPADLEALRGRDLRREAAWIAAALGRTLGDPPVEPDGVEAGVLAHLARLNKAVLFLPAGPATPTLARDLHPVVEAVRLRTAAMNLRALALGRDANRRLGAAGVRPLHLKGPLQQIDLFGSPSLRPVADVDLLVPAGDRARAAATLREAGFQAEDGLKATWWSWFLGEAHLRGPGGVVDLHHRLDQPGIPALRGLHALFSDARETEWGGEAFLVPSRGDAALVAALGVVKAVIAGEPCGGHLLDARAALDRLDGAERRALDARAARLGLGGVLALAAQALDATFGAQAGRRWGEGLGPLGITPDDLRLLLLAPWALGPARPRRRAILWALSGGSPLRFARGAGWMGLANGYRRGLDALAGRGGART